MTCRSTGRTAAKLLAIIAALMFGGCGPQSALLETDTLVSAKLDKPIGFSVLRAPDLPEVDPAELPVVLFLHGMGSDHLAFDEFGVSERLWQAMVRGEMPPVHLIFPNGERGFYIDWYDGSHPYEAYILEEVLPKAEAVLGVSPTPESRHIAGVSMGGIGALQIGLRHPDLFASISCLSGVILTRKEANEMMDTLFIKLFAPVERVWGDGTDDAFSDSINPYKLIERPAPKPRIFLAYGTEEKDRIRETTERFHARLGSTAFRRKLVVYEGGHDWESWTPIIQTAVRFSVAK